MHNKSSDSPSLRPVNPSSAPQTQLARLLLLAAPASHMPPSSAPHTTSPAHLLLLAALDAVVGTLGLVGGDEGGVVDAGQRDHVAHQRHKLLLQLKVHHLRALHRVGQVHACVGSI